VVEAGAGAGRGDAAVGDLFFLFCDAGEAHHAVIRAAGIPAALQAARPAGLEDVFLRLTGRRLRD
jgi:hypothetical protein